MKGEEQLINSFYTEFWLYLVALIALIVIIVFTIVLRNKLLIRFNKSQSSKIILYSIISLFCLGAAFLGFKFTTYSLDFNSVINNEYITVTGTVIDYSKVTSNENGSTDNFRPIIKIQGTEDRITLNVLNTELNNTYTFIYLKHTKLAAIKEKL